MRSSLCLSVCASRVCVFVLWGLCECTLGTGVLGVLALVMKPEGDEPLVFFPKIQMAVSLSRQLQ